MKKSKITALCLAIMLSVSQTAFAAEIPMESTPQNATNESVQITENLIAGILDEVQNGLGYGEAWIKANNTIFNAVTTGQTNGIGYAPLADIARNSIFQYRDMCLRPEYHTETRLYVNNLIADIITDVKNGKDYNVALKESYIRILKDKDQTFNAEENFSVDICYRDIPAVDSVLFTYARKLLQEAIKG